MPKHEVMFLIGSYLLGSIPFGFILFWLTEKKDIRGEGSGNIGATNVMRTKGKGAGIATLLLDITKGALPVLYGMKHFDSPVILISGGAAVVVGHMFPAYIKFKGGKGVASYLGALIPFNFPAALAFGLGFFSFFAFKKRVSVGSIAAVTTAFFYTLFTQVVEISIIVFMISIMIIFKHHSNIRRLTSGTENVLKTELSK
jgi:glycerol-3-phosphate acyltransferase PlsY